MGNEKQKYYRLDKILRYEVPYRLIIGERSNGKTYSVKERCWRKYQETGEQFVYVRKRQDSISRKEMKKLMSDINEDIIFSDIGDYVAYSTDNGFYYDMDGQRITIGYALSLEEYESKKGIPFNQITTIFFDEFIEKRGDLDDEVSKFLNLVSTIRRKRDNVEIFMCANTVTRFSPYFEEFGIDIKQLRQGECHYIKHEMGAEVAIEYCESKNIVKGVKQKDKYFGFDHSPASNMIMYGEWEYDIVNTKNVDGIGWSAKRKLVPMYVTALGEVYEMSFYTGVNPIFFVRKINTQNGFVKPFIKYNLSFDESLVLQSKDGIIPRYGKVNPLISSDIRQQWELLKLCIEAKRIVFDSMSTGSDFLRITKNL